eukprot:TRINITY_DN85_c0_g1_i2.p1 TRINITY_DN85_c0_g1~~TRINITY_DN85_c0_g1_i2.p1  ORF type:complete len:658 (-),score=226.68 TRINITY_DN85_c0_g1_i2:68-2041(-)
MDRNTEPLPDGGMLPTLVVGIVVMVVVTIVYLLIRRFFPRVYFPKDEENGDEKKFLSWAPWVLLSTDDMLLAAHGPRALLHLSYLRLLMVYLMIMLFTTLPFILPINILGSESTSPFGKTVTSFLPVDDDGVWASFAVSVWHLVLILALLIYHMAYYLTLRTRMRNERTLVNRTVKVVGVDPKQVDEAALRSDITVEGIAAQDVHIALDRNKLLKLQEKRHEHELKIEELSEYGERVEMRPERLKLPGILTCNGKVDAMEWSREELAKVRDKIGAQNEKLAEKRKGAGVAFATYSCVEDAQKVIAAWGWRREGMRARPAHSPKEILWEHLGAGAAVRLLKTAVFNAIVVVIAFFFTIPISFLSSLELWVDVPGIGPIVSAVISVNPIITALLSKLLPVLLQLIFFILLPIILTKMADVEKHHSFTAAEASVQVKMYIFLILNNVIFLVLFLGGVDAANQVAGGGADSIGEALRTLNWGIYSSYFCNWLLGSALIAAPLSVLAPARLIVQWLKLRLAKTPKGKRVATALSPYRFSISYAKHGMAFAIIAMFIPIAPIVRYAAARPACFLVRSSFRSLPLLSSLLCSSLLVWLLFFPSSALLSPLLSALFFSLLSFLVSCPFFFLFPSSLFSSPFFGILVSLFLFMPARNSLCLFASRN